MFSSARILCETMYLCQFYHHYNFYKPILSQGFEMSLPKIQSQGAILKIRISELENDVRHLSQINKLSSKTIKQIQKTLQNALAYQSSGIHSFSIVGKSLSENASVGGERGIKRSLSYDISSQIDQGNMQAFRGLHNAITSIIEQYKKSNQSADKQQPLSPSAALPSNRLIKKVLCLQAQAYQIPVELLLDFKIEEVPCFVPSEAGHVKFLGGQPQQTTIQKSAQVIAVKEKREVQILKKQVQDLVRQNKQLLQQLEQIKQNSQLEFFIEICTQELNHAANSHEQGADIPITFLIQNEAGDVLDVQVVEDGQGEVTLQPDPNLTTSITHKIELPTAPDILQSRPLEQSRLVLNTLQQSAISIDFEEHNFSQSPDKTAKHIISIQQSISILYQRQDPRLQVTTIPVQAEAIAEVNRIEKIQNFHQKIAQKIVHVYNIAEIPVEIILIEEDRGLTQDVQDMVPSLKKTNLEGGRLQFQANYPLKERKFYPQPQKGCQQEDLKAGNLPQSKLNQQPLINPIDYKYAMMEIPVELYIQRILQVPVQLQEKVDYKVSHDAVYDKAKRQDICRQIAQIPVEIVIIEDAFSENELDGKLAGNNREQDKRQEQTKLRIVQIPVELDIQNNEAQNKFGLLQKIHLESSNSSLELIRCLYVEIGKLQKIVVELNQQKQQVLYEMEHKSLNEEILKKKLGDKELTLIRKEEEIQNIINKHQQNMNLFTSYRDEYAQFVHNITKGGVYSFQITNIPPITPQSANSIEITKRISQFAGDESYGQRLGSQRYDARLPEELPAASRATEVPSREKTASSSVGVQTQFVEITGERAGAKDKVHHFSILPVQTPNIQDHYDPIKQSHSQRTHSLEEDLLPSLQTSPYHSPQYHLYLDSNKNVDEQFLMSEEKYEHAYLHKLYEDALIEAEKYRGLYYQTDEVLLQLRAQINDQTLEIQSLNNHINIQAEEIEEKNKRIDEMGEHATECEGKISAFERRVDKLEEECRRVRAEYQALEVLFADRVGKLRQDIEEKGHDIYDQKQECERHKQLYQAQIQRLRDEVASRQQQIETLQKQISMKQSQTELLKDENSDFKKLVQRNQLEEVDAAAAIYEQEFIKVKEQFQRREHIVREQVQAMARQNESLKQRWQNQHKQSQKLNALSQDLILQLAEKEKNDKPKTQNLNQNKQNLRQLVIEPIKSLAGNRQIDDNEPFQIRVEHLSRLQTGEKLELSIRYIRVLEKLLLQYQANMKTTLLQMEDFFEILCNFYRQKLLKEQYKRIQQTRFPLQSNITNALLSKKIALSIENDRLAKMASIAEKKLQFLWGELSHTHKKTADINRD